MPNDESLIVLWRLATVVQLASKFFALNKTYFAVYLDWMN